MSVSTCDSKEQSKLITLHEREKIMFVLNHSIPDNFNKHEKQQRKAMLYVPATLDRHERFVLTNDRATNDWDRNCIRDTASVTAIHLNRKHARRFFNRSSPLACFTKRDLHQQVQSLKTHFQIFTSGDPVQSSYCTPRLHNMSHEEGTATTNSQLLQTVNSEDFRPHIRQVVV